MAKDRNVPSAVLPTNFAAEIPGQLLVLKDLRKADAAVRPPRADYARGSDQDRAGNRGHR
jgi:hypothetical protein